MKKILPAVMLFFALASYAHAQSSIGASQGIATTSSGAGVQTHQVTTSSNAQAISASCDANYPITEWDVTSSHSFTAPTITLGGGCTQGQQLILRQIQDATGGITPNLAAAAGVTLHWQANGGSQPTFATTANAADMMRFGLSTYPSGTNLILTSWLPNMVPSLAAVGSPCSGLGVVTALGTTGPTCTTLHLTNVQYITSGTSYTAPSGATLLRVTLAAAGGGGGAATSGGATNESAGGGGSGGVTTFLVFSPAGSYTYSLGSAGSAGGCGASPATAGNGGNSTFTVGSATLTDGGGGAGGTATTAAGGTAGSAGTAGSGTTAFAAAGTAIISNQGGNAGGAGGNNTTFQNGGAIGGPGGTGTVVNTGTCSGTAATAGIAGYMIVEAFGAF